MIDAQAAALAVGETKRVHHKWNPMTGATSVYVASILIGEVWPSGGRWYGKTAQGERVYGAQGHFDGYPRRNSVTDALIAATAEQAERDGV